MKFELVSSRILKDLDRKKILHEKCVFLEKLITGIDQILRNVIDLNNLIKLAEHDNVLINEINTQLIECENTFSQLKMLKMFFRKNDNCNCYVDIQSGSGGIEAQDWANMLLRMYLRWLDNKKFNTKIISESTGDLSGIKSVTIHVIGLYAYGWLKTESGVHRLVRKSPFDSSGKRHTSFASVFVYPEINDSIDINIKPEDIRIDVYRSSGSGGQHVNRTESAVRVTHLPTNIVTQCQSDRSQHRNKTQAIKQLKARLYNFELQKKKIEQKIRECEKQDITWGSQIRSYILDNARVKDLRTGLEKRNVKAVLNGDLDDFIKKNIENLNANYNI